MILLFVLFFGFFYVCKVAFGCFFVKRKFLYKLNLERLTFFESLVYPSKETVKFEETRKKLLFKTKRNTIN